jgi:acetyl esterase/lipase
MKLLNLFVLLLTFLPGVSFSQTQGLEIPLWKNGAPGFENRKNEQQTAKDYWIANIHNPSITAYLPPKEKANGTAVVICPGGGHRLLVYNAEGVEPATYLNSLGIAAFVLKYRLGREENSPYNLQKHPLEDAQRAIRMVRSRAKEWNIDTNKVGILGFSAGGEVVSMVAYDTAPGNLKSKDIIERSKGTPDFQMLVYPGPLGIPGTIPADAPPAFLITANDDECCSGSTVEILQKYRQAKRPVEAHILSSGGHGFNMGNRSKLEAVKTWPQRMADWLKDNNLR